MDFSSQRFFSPPPPRLECCAKHRSQDRSDTTVGFFFLSLPQHHLLQLPTQPRALCGASVTATAPRTSPRARSSVPGSAEVFILRRSCQGSSLTANGPKSASSFPSDHILLFPNTEQTYLATINPNPVFICRKDI